MNITSKIRNSMLACMWGMSTMGYLHAQVPLVFDVENRGAACTKPAMKLKTNSKFPDPFEWSNGSGRVSTCDEWSCRRNEIKAEIENYEIGEKPAPPANITATYSGGTLTVKVTENGQTLTLTSAFTVPSGTGPFPVMIGMGGFGGIGDQLNGIIQCTFNHDQVVSYSAGSGTRNSADPFYKLYPNLTSSGKYCGWSWGVSRLIDGLAIVKKAGTLNVDMSRIGVVGCSYAGKMALFAGALDERIALTIAEESGGGGINSWRTSKEFNIRTGTNIEKIDNTNFSWFKQSMSSLDPYQLPYDHHELIAMVAPRAFLSLGNPDMVWLCDESGYKSLRAAQEVWKAFGVTDRFGFDFEANHSHCSASTVQKADATKFIDKFMRAKTTVNTDITTNPFGSVDMKSWITWTTPTIVCAPADPNIPTVTITEPASGATAETGASLTISATIADADNNVTKIEFLVDGVKTGEDLAAPYSFMWTATDKGMHTITVKATDAKANSSSKEVAVTVIAPQTPYGGVAKPIPGTIQLEEYDEGGNGIAYNDGTTGSAVTPAVNFRTSEDVDVETCTDAGAGYNLGYTMADEWTEYTVNVASAGTYKLTLRAACNGAGRTVTLSSKGIDIAKDIAIPNTAGWQTWQDVLVGDVKLNAGVQVLRLTIGATDYVNLNYITFAATPTPPALNTVKLRAGWNLIGCPIAGSTDIALALSSIWTQVEAVKNNNAFYLVPNSAALNSLTKLDFSMGYMVKVKAACELDWSVK